MYQCKRMGSLFKTVYDDGRIEYNDIDRIMCWDKNSDTSYSNGFVRKIASEYVKDISMPYIPPTKPMYVLTRDYLSDPKNGDFDTIAIYTLKVSDSESIYINRYFKCDIGIDEGFVEINYQEFLKRVNADKKRRVENN